MIPTFRSSKPDEWTSPRPIQDHGQRLRTHGALQPMDEARCGLGWTGRILWALSAAALTAALFS